MLETLNISCIPQYNLYSLHKYIKKFTSKIQINHEILNTFLSNKLLIIFSLIIQHVSISSHYS
jgi:hypothetical protein